MPLKKSIMTIRHINIIIRTNKDTTFEELNDKHGLDKLPKVFDMFCKKYGYIERVI